ncbi:membrane-spanning 4-domains subfamily A member 15-like [Pleurodeles waltl]|uniref:membrane-spanning 4-domains subfamily A member 15-like n=1 Tax=Pleurodeles waltl TaxID=8319 RepID=UPI0037096BEA
MSSTVAESSNVKVVTEVYSPHDPRVAQLRKISPEKSHDSNISQVFKKVQPKAIGTVQIVVGLLQILFAIVVTSAEVIHKTLTTSSGVYFWIGVVFLISGCITVTVETKDISWLVKASVAANLLGLVVAVVALIIHTVELTTVFNLASSDPPPSKNVYILKIGCNIMFHLFILLQLGTSVAVLVFGWKALRNVQRYDPMI